MLRKWANLYGWRTREKLLVIESDDWGAIRTPDRATLDALQSGSHPIRVSRFDTLDCLESKVDFDSMLELLSKHVDSYGNPAKMTLNTVMGNPNFDAIRDAEFEGFVHEHLFDSYFRYHGQDLRQSWRSGIETNLIRPQFHAREHLNSGLWLRDLRNGAACTRRAFDLGFFAGRNGTSSQIQPNYLAAYWCESKSDVAETRDILLEGLEMFERTFGIRSKTFVPCNYIFPVELERVLSNRGVEMIQGQRAHAVPDTENSGRLKTRRRYTGQSGTWVRHYSVRNVVFEPYKDVTRDWTRTALSEIAEAYRFRRPAVVVSHRVNFVSGLDVSHRDRSLKMLDRLLKEVLNRWPETIFVSSDELAARMADSL